MRPRNPLIGVLWTGAVACALLLSGSESFGQANQTTCNDGYVKRGRACVEIAKATDSEVRKLMMASSLATYRGNCPCPYNTDRAGRSCGRRSAYSRPGGAAPLCYETDITATAVKQFRARYPSKQ